jgi:hypothetical protein
MDIKEKAIKLAEIAGILKRTKYILHHGCAIKVDKFEFNDKNFIIYGTVVEGNNIYFDDEYHIKYDDNYQIREITDDDFIGIISRVIKYHKYLKI